MMVKSFLIADSPVYGKDQIISGTLRYPWAGCKVADELEAHNEVEIAKALEIAKTDGYDNIREVMCYYKQKIYSWGVGWKKYKEKIVPFKR